MSAPVKGCEKCAGTGVRSVSVEFPNGYGAGGSVDCDCRTVPAPVVNEYEGVQSDVERIARQLHAQHQDEPVWDKLDGHKRDDYHLFAARVLQCPSVAAAFEARAKLAELQAAPSGSKDLELAEAQAKLEAATAYLREVHEVLSITTNYLLGQGEGEGRDLEECRALATNEALAGFERLDRVLFPKGGV